MKKVDNFKVISQNKKAYHEYTIEEKIEAGIALLGSEVKSLRCSQASIAESYATNEGNEIFLLGANIKEYKQAKQFNHYPKRKRKLLLHKKEIKKLIGLIRKKGYTLVPLSLYFNEKNLAKLLLGIARGKKKHDKREAIKEREWSRKKARVLKG